MTADANIIATLRGVDVAYDDKTVLKDFSLTINRGQRVALVGPSGGGKSTLLRVLSASQFARNGEVRLFDQDPQALRTGLRRRLRKRIALVPQQHYIVPSLSVAANVNMGFLGDWPWYRALWALLSKHNHAEVRTILQRFGIDHLIDQRAGMCSGGEQQRVAIARAMAQQTELLLTDEPTAHIDPQLSSTILDDLADLTQAEALTWVCCLHDIEFARTHFDIVVGVRAGRLSFALPAAECDDATLLSVYQGSDSTCPSV